MFALAAAVALVAVSFAIAGSGSAGARGGAACKPGSVAATIAGTRVCLAVGQRCRRALDARYHRYGFHCHATAKLTRKRPAPTNPTPPTPPAPQPPPASAPATVTVTGRPQVVFDWTTDRCEQWDIPDLSARALRDASGQVQLVVSHYVSRLLIGPDLDHLRHDCSVVLGSHFNADPAAYDDHEWLASTWTPDGQTVYAFVHDEYQGNRHPGRCPSQDYDRCWWNTITFATSSDGGRTYAHGTPPALVAAFPYRYVPDHGTFGPMMPSNIVRNTDGYYYALVYVKDQPTGARNSNHVCLIRTGDVADPASWRAWSGGTTFSTTFVDPYRSDADPVAHECRGIEALGGHPVGSLTFATEAKQWIAVSPGSDGFYSSTSPDLLNWTQQKLLLAGTPPWRYACGDPAPVHYPSLLDPSSPSRNFETTGKTAFLYYTQFHPTGCVVGSDRDLVRVPVTISS